MRIKLPASIACVLLCAFGSCRSAPDPGPPEDVIAPPAPTQEWIGEEYKGASFILVEPGIQLFVMDVNGAQSSSFRLRALEWMIRELPASAAYVSMHFDTTVLQSRGSRRVELPPRDGNEVISVCAGLSRDRRTWNPTVRVAQGVNGEQLVLGGVDGFAQIANTLCHRY